ncbi:DNA mismatch repair protein MutS [Dirofilaria immitis]
MALDDDQKDGNKENIPVNEDKIICWQVSHSIMQKMKQEVTRQVLAELTINNSDESDESNGREDNGCQRNSDIHQSSFLSQQSDFFGDFQNNETSIDGLREELTRINKQHECYIDNASKNKERTAINKGDDNEKKSCEDLEEFITPPLYTIPGIELEHKVEECSSKTLSKIIFPI